MAYFDGIKKGDRVYSMNWGWGTVCEVDITEYLSLNVAFDSGDSRWFGLDGCLRYESIQTLFWSKPEFTPPPRPKRKVKKVIERWVNVYPSGKQDCFDCEDEAKFKIRQDNGFGLTEPIVCVKLTGEYEVEK